MLSVTSCVTPHVTCHVSHVTCHNYFYLYFFIFFSDKAVKLLGGGSVINRAYPVQFHSIVHLSAYMSLSGYPHSFLKQHDMQDFQREKKYGLISFQCGGIVQGIYKKYFFTTTNMAIQSSFFLKVILENLCGPVFIILSDDLFLPLCLAYIRRGAVNVINRCLPSCCSIVILFSHMWIQLVHFFFSFLLDVFLVLISEL